MCGNSASFQVADKDVRPLQSPADYITRICGPSAAPNMSLETACSETNSRKYRSTRLPSFPKGKKTVFTPLKTVVKRIDYVINTEVQSYSKRNIIFQKFILQKLLIINPCPVYGWKGNLSKF
jgi:hypothetical protein